MNEIIILGPWHFGPKYIMDCRDGIDKKHWLSHQPGRWDAKRLNWSVFHKCDFISSGVGDREQGERWARNNGWLLLDAEPGSYKDTLPPWVAVEAGFKQREGKRIVLLVDTQARRPSWYSESHIWQVLDVQEERVLAWGFQEGAEAERYAEAAALALGCTLEGGAA